MTRMTDYGLHVILPDGEHIYYGYDEKPTVAMGKFLAFNTVAGIRYLPLTTLNKHTYNLNLKINNQTMRPIEDELQFTVDTWFQKSGSGQNGPIPYVTGTNYLKFDSDTSEEIIIDSFDFIYDLNGNMVSKIYSGNTYEIIPNPSRIISPPPNYFRYQSESSEIVVEWKLPNTDGTHSYYTFNKYA